MTVIMDCGQNKDILGRHLGHFFYHFWDFMDQMNIRLIKKVINRLIENENNHQLQPYTDMFNRLNS